VSTDGTDGTDKAVQSVDHHKRGIVTRRGNIRQGKAELDARKARCAIGWTLRATATASEAREAGFPSKGQPFVSNEWLTAPQAGCDVAQVEYNEFALRQGRSGARMPYTAGCGPKTFGRFGALPTLTSVKHNE